MIFIYILIFIILIIACFWQASLIYAQFLGAPSVNSSHEAEADAFKLVGLKAGEMVVDLGCGNGSALIMAARKFKAKGVGVERSPYYYLLAKLNVWKNGQTKNIKIYFGDFKKIESEVRKADVVYLYLLNSVLADIENWLFENIKSDGRIVSLAFHFPKHQPAKVALTRTLGKETEIRLYIK